MEMGGSTGCFRSRLPPLLTTKEISNLSLKSNLSVEDIQQWYSSFVHCYPHGYLSRNQFIIYYQQLKDESNVQLRPLIEKLFEVFDLNNDNKLDFHEFVLLNVLSSNGSINEKIKLIFRLYEKEKEKLLSRDEIKDFLRNMFYIFDIPSSKFNLNEVINIVFKTNNINRDEKIYWKQFTEDILNDQALFKQLISLDYYHDYQFVQRSERF
ncbi:unnamed protein product [Adineta steineri]|uniref:EF-hand domain-containing protein n=1 Tax=Adineta steineri TaxID=433720 RepID=A0A815IRL7_9BILA|nr:unnamed protein product [Adineta steineri]CAF1369993.1 unnamed protein product [Adineta steineri]CAF3725935.1 unnamed protein product [Adineta steineri]CAF3735556.1 unnamed protein product [Adineta steineri]